MSKVVINNKNDKNTGKAHSYIFKWYACGYAFIAVAVLHLNYDKWF